MFSSFLGDNNDWRELRSDVVRGSLLFEGPVPLVKLGVLTGPLSSFPEDLRGIGPFITLRRFSRSTKYRVDCVDRPLVGVCGIDTLLVTLGGVIDALARRPCLRLPPLLPSLSCSSQDLISSPAMFLTSTAVSASASLWMVS